MSQTLRQNLILVILATVFFACMNYSIEQISQENLFGFMGFAILSSIGFLISTISLIIRVWNLK